MTPTQIKLAVLAAGLVAAFGAGGWLGWEVNGWRLGTKVANLERQLQREIDQAAVLAGGLKACNAGVDAAKKAGDEVLALSGRLLDAAKKVHRDGTATAARLEELLKKPPPPGADCNRAWDDIEADQKARGAP